MSNKISIRFFNDKEVRAIWDEENSKWWFSVPDSLDAKSKAKAYALFESSLLDSIEIGTVNGLKQIHGYLFGGLYDFAGKIRTVNISKGGFKFAAAEFLPETLDQIEKMSEDSFDQIIDKYVEMNVAHPFREGNGRTTRIWLDLILKRSLKKCVDWSQINKKDYLEAMEQSVLDSTKIKFLIQNALTDKINDRERIQHMQRRVILANDPRDRLARQIPVRFRRSDMVPTGIAINGYDNQQVRIIDILFAHLLF